MVSTELQNSLPLPLPLPSYRQQRSQSPNLAVPLEIRASSRGFSPSQQPRGRGHTVPSHATVPQNASRQNPVAVAPEPTRAAATTYAHRRSTSLTGMNQSAGNSNVNRWSKSTASSAASTHSTHRRASSTTRRMSLSGSTTFLLGADNTTPEKKQYRNPSLTAYGPPSTRPFGNSLTLPPIVTLPSLQTSVENGSSPLNGPNTPSPSTAGLLSAAVRTTVPDYFGRAWEDSTPRAFSANAESKSAVSQDDDKARPSQGQEGRRPSRGHSRHRSGAGKSSGTGSGGSNRNSKGSSQKAMLSKALQKANTAVLLDNAQNFEGAMQAYSEACGLLQQVMSRSSGDEDRRKLEAIHNTYTSRISELRRLTPQVQDDGKALPQRPESEQYRGDESSAPDDEDEMPVIQTATATRIVTEQSYFADPQQARSIPTSQLPIRRESLMPSALEAMQFKGKFGLDPGIEGSQSKSPMRERVKEMNIELPPPMESIYMPPPLSPRRPSSPMTHGSPNNSRPRPPSDLYKTSNALSATSKGHNRAPSNESMSWLDTIDESGGSAASSVHSRTSSMGVRRKRIRAASGATEAEFDAALDAAVEAAYDEGLEPIGGYGADRYDHGEDFDEEDDDDDAIVANVRRKVELAKERVRQSEREAGIQDALERERKRLFSQAPAISHGGDYGNESEEDERMLEEVTRGYVMDDFGLHSKSALPRESNSSGFSGRTSGWNSSIGSNPTTAGTLLSTVTEASTMPQIPSLQSKAAYPPPAQALPSPPPPPATNSQQSLAPASQGVRSRRLSGQNPKQLKIETAGSAQADSLSNPPSMPPPRVPDGLPGLVHPKTAGLPPRQPQTSSRPPLTVANRQASASAPFAGIGSTEIISPPTPVLAQTTSAEMDPDALPRSGSPGRAQSRGGLRKNFSSSSLKNMKSRNLSVSNVDDGPEHSPVTPGSSQFNPRDNTRLPAMPALPTPLAAAFTNKMNAPAGGLYLFTSDIHSPESPGSPNPLSGGAPIPLEPCPTEFLLRPYWLMRALYQTIAHPRGGYLSTKLFVPRDVWRVKGVKIKSVEDKIANCDFLTAALMKLARVDTFDADAVLEEMQALEGVLEQVQATLTKKLGNEVGVQASGGMFKDASTGGDGDGNTASSKSGSTSSKTSSFSWRRLRSKNSGVALSNAYSNKGSTPEIPKEGLTIGTLPMTSTAVAKVRFAKRDIREVQFSGPNATYMSALARLFDAAQAIDQIARQVEDPGLRHADKTQVGLDLCTRHAAEFFGFYICRFVLTDIGLLLDKFIKRGSEWVLV
ncbi:hypothetical protein BJ875DRAFT_142848 [Amylocarpus encephaloides]|uniref:MIT domain-containing protein n=1 Tax=Amylocarpus encephaloides TaxID=45428 RepID=A0A9P7YPY2_9HELO|nr:hypothetical protein BJ875DRAFT_142848 [Amylocarpus encephaloides]